MVVMKKKLIAIVVGVSIGILISLTANADLDKAIAYAEAGDVKKGQMELVNIAQRGFQRKRRANSYFTRDCFEIYNWITQGIR